MLREYMKIPHQIVLQTDFKASLQQTEVDHILPLPKEPRNVYAHQGINCFRRLKYFDPRYSSQFGTEWVMSLDLDTLILGDITERIEWAMNDFGFCIIRGRLAVEEGQRPYNGSMYLLRVGEHAHVWDDFDWTIGPHECARSGWRGSDQVWLSLKIQGAPTLGPEHGVYFYHQYLDSSDDDPDPTMIHYAGLQKPWSKMCKREAPELWDEYRRFV
jgi:lipopolysaccharide biosynthesis glycosyltransferase